MRGSNLIHKRPYIPPTKRENYYGPYICRLAPFENGFEFEWLDNYCLGKHTLYYCIRGKEEKINLPIEDTVVKVEGLLSNQEYEFYLESESGRRSNTRLVRTGIVPEGSTVINYLHPQDSQYDFSGRYLASPSLARTKSGRLIAGMDVFAFKGPQNLTVLFYSDNDGKDWRYLTDLYPFYWGSLFYHHEVLYMLGLTTEYGNLQIICSKDEGLTWSAPVTLFYGSNVFCKYGGVHRSPMHMVLYKERFYTTCEYGSWGMGSHLPRILSIDESADPMQPENWYCSDILPYDGAWREAAEKQQPDQKQGDTIEGNIVVGPDGELYNFLRWRAGSILKLRVNTKDLDKAPEFVDIVDAPVTNSMFRIISVDEKYFLISNRKTPAMEVEHWRCRNVLSISESKDLEQFKLVRDIFNFEKEDPEIIGFQYPTFLCENKQISLVVRSAFNHADSSHDSNYMLFYRFDA